jgi:hypothetical protein
MLATIVCGLLASGASAVAQSSDGHCSNPTLLGNYGFAAKGVIRAGKCTLDGYQPGSWGPAEADRLAAGVGGWQNPEAA